jgi:ferredoxin
MSNGSHARAVVDHDVCAGAAQCVLKAPNVFRLNDNGLSVFDPRGEWTEEELQNAADSCPMAAIDLGVDDGG